jgi:O-antigen ligase
MFWRRLTFVVTGLAVVPISFVLGALGAQDAALAIALVFAAAATFVCLARPEAALYITVAILYSNAAAIAVQFHGLPYFAGIAFPALLLLPLAQELVFRRHAIVVTSAFPLLVLYAIVQLVGAAQASDVRASATELTAFFIGGLGLWFLLANTIRSFDTMRRTIWTVLIVAAVIGAISAYQLMTGAFDNEFWGFSQVDLPGSNTVYSVSAATGGTPRIAGPIGEVDRYGQIMMVLLPIGALVAYGAKSFRLRAAGIGLTALILLGMATSGTRGAALGLAVIVLAGIALRYIRGRHLVIIAVVLAITLQAFPHTAERLSNLQGLFSLDKDTGTQTGAGSDVGNLRGRATEALAALLVFLDHPLVGVGPGMFPQNYQIYAARIAATTTASRVDRGTREAHNLYTQIAAESGILGFACFMGILLVTLRDLRRARRRWLTRRPDIAHLATGFFLSIVGYMVSGLFLHLSFERYFWLLMALAGITAYLALHLPDDEPDKALPAESAGAPAERAALPAERGAVLTGSPRPVSTIRGLNRIRTTSPALASH